jgi:acetoin utilization deacetylase AcuC-like enzyme
VKAFSEGSKGSWTAAVAAVSAALQATDMIMSGECTNAFCPTRPPGHHAGRELHAMKAVSNGFCVLNAVACAAMYATAPISEGGLGLSRVCIIDIDVHHGNGTQDILCSTFDPRFLYVSIHAGGAHVNGVDLGDEGAQIVGHQMGRSLNKKGIFPGRCGDTSPHDGVLNIPLGTRVTSHALGTALVTKVSPTVDKFSPELIIVSAGFDAHKNDPLNMGGLEAQDFGTLTEVICKLAHKSCSGRVLSVLEGGYGVPCCRPQYFPPAEAHLDRKIDEKKASPAVLDQKAPDETRNDNTLQSVSSLKSSDGETNSEKGVSLELFPMEKSNLSGEKYDDNQGMMATENAGKSIEIERVARPQLTVKDETSKLADRGVASRVGSTSLNYSELQEDQIVPLQCLELGEDLPPDMMDVVASYALQKRLDKCHAEGFLHCVREHVSALARCSVWR